MQLKLEFMCFKPRTSFKNVSAVLLTNVYTRVQLAKGFGIGYVNFLVFN